MNNILEKIENAIANVRNRLTPEPEGEGINYTTIHLTPEDEEVIAGMGPRFFLHPHQASSSK